MRLDDFALHAVFAVLCLAFGAAEISAQKGQKAQTYVDSLNGKDIANCGGYTSPCKTINKALTVTESEGTIELLFKDSRSKFESRDCINPYAPANIDKSITIEASESGDGMPCIAAWTGKPGITIAATADKVIILGLRFVRPHADTEVTKQTVGIKQISGSSLIVENCYFALNFEGINYSEGQMIVRGTTFMNNGFGVSMKGTARKSALIENSNFTRTTQAAIRAEPQTDVTVSGGMIVKLENRGVPFEAIPDVNNPDDKGGIVFRVQNTQIAPTQGFPLMLVKEDTHFAVKLFMNNVTIR